MEKDVNELRVTDFMELSYEELVEELEKLGEPILGRLIQQLEMEHRDIRAGITKIRAQIISDAFEDTNNQPYREGDMDSMPPRKRDISSTQVLTVEGLLTQLNNYYYAESLILKLDFVLRGIKQKKAKKLMSGE